MNKFLIILLFPVMLYSQKIPEWNIRKTGMVLFSLTGSYLEATKEANPSMKYYHETKYASSVCYMITGFCFGLEFKKDQGFRKNLLRTVGLALMNWTIWEIRYAESQGNGTYNGWPFKRAWLSEKHIDLWNVCRFILGFFLFWEN